MRRCRTCCLPDTKPDLHFDDTGQCSACRAYAERPEIDWEERKTELFELLDRHHGECIVPSSGGKDSTWQVLTLQEMGAHVTVVTATTCHLTTLGRKNIDNLARYATTYEVSPNKIVRAKLNCLGLSLVGDISWPEHVAIFTTPFNMACSLNTPLIFYGENPQREYGGPPDSHRALEMTRRWVSEYGGFLGLRPQDMIGMEGITEADMWDYMPPTVDQLDRIGVEAHFLGQYLPWDSMKNASVAAYHGMEQEKPCVHSHWEHENLDNAQVFIHDLGMYFKYGYGRVCAQVSVDIRSGRLTRESGEKIVSEHDGKWCDVYAGVTMEEVADRIDMTVPKIIKTLKGFADKEILKTWQDPQ